MKKYELVTVDKPRLLEDIFPHHLPPQVSFEATGIPINSNLSARTLRITDTTFRDGQQGLQERFTAEQIVVLYKFLASISGPQGIIQESEFFLYRDEDLKGIIACQELGLPFPKITGWIRGSGGDGAKLTWMRQHNINETGLLTPSSDYHIFLKLRMDRKKALDKYLSVVQRTLEKGVRPRCHLEDVTRADIHGFVLPFIQQLMRISEELDPTMKIKIRLCDTMGFGLPDPHVSLPRGIPRLVHTLRHEAGVPTAQLEWHGHNDLGKAHANTVAAWLYGCDLVNTTLASVGERTGNTALEQCVMEYISLKGSRDGMNTNDIPKAIGYMRQIGVPIADNLPLVGKDAFTTKAGIHIKGIEQDERIYLPFDSRTLLDRAPRVILNDKSGPEGVTYCINLYLRSKGLLANRPPATEREVLGVIRWWNEQYKAGRTAPISDAELEDQIHTHLPHLLQAPQAPGHDDHQV